MPILNWREQDWIEFLSTMPVAEKYEVQHEFTVSKGGVLLRLTVHQYESAVRIELAAEPGDAPLIELACFVRERATVQEYKGQQWLELRDCVLSGSRFSYIEMGDVFDQRRYPYGHHVRVWIEPLIRVEIVRG